MSYPPPPGPPGQPQPGGQPYYPPPGGQPPAGTPPPGYTPQGYPPPGYQQGYPGYPQQGGYPAQPPSGGSSKVILVVLGGVAVVFVLVVALAAVFILRGSGGGDVELSQSQAESALLTEGDLGGGFTTQPAGTDDEPFRPEDVRGDEACVDLIRELERGDQSPLAERTFSRTEGEATTEVSQTIENVGDDTPALSELRDLVETCREFTLETGTQTARFTVEKADDPSEVGSDRVTMSLRVNFTVPFEAEVRLLVTTWQRSGVRSTISLSGALSQATFQSEAPDASRMGGLLDKADEAR